MPKNTVTAAKPTKSIFDPFNSSATGHQRADSRLAGSTSWRDSRNLKLRNQYVSGSGGGARLSDTVGAGSEDFGLDGRLENGSFAPGAKGLRTGGQLSIWESMRVTKKEEDDDVQLPKQPLRSSEGLDKKPTTVVNPFTPFRKPDGTVRETSWTSHEQRQDFDITSSESREFAALQDQMDREQRAMARDDIEQIATPRKIELGDEQDTASQSSTPRDRPPQIFTGLTIYINGSTAPLISDHRLKYLLSTHGARTSVSLGRKTVTHVILASTDGYGRCGGGLASSKIHKEITKVRGKGIKFVTAAWIVESVKAGKRLPESRYRGINLASHGVDSVANVFRRPKTDEEENQKEDGG